MLKYSAFAPFNIYNIIYLYLQDTNKGSFAPSKGDTSTVEEIRVENTSIDLEYPI